MVQSAKLRHKSYNKISAKKCSRFWNQKNISKAEKMKIKSCQNCCQLQKTRLKGHELIPMLPVICDGLFYHCYEKECNSKPAFLFFAILQNSFWNTRAFCFFKQVLQIYLLFLRKRKYFKPCKIYSGIFLSSLCLALSSWSNILLQWLIILKDLCSVMQIICKALEIYKYSQTWSNDHLSITTNILWSRL